MALPGLEIGTLDYEKSGYPVITWMNAALGDPGSLDYERQGMPVYAQFSNLGSIVLSVTIPTPAVKFGYRDLPNQAEANIRESQVARHGIPGVSPQDPALLP